MTIEELTDRLHEVRGYAGEVRNELRNMYRSQFAPADPRMEVARHIKAILSASFLSAVHMRENLRHPGWWAARFALTPTKPQAEEELQDYHDFIVLDVVVMPFSLFEAGLRRVVRAIEPTACDGGAAEFKSIYAWLLAHLRRNGWVYPHGDAEAFLDLYRHLRNTIHNNGVFYDRRGRDVTVKWDGITYEFFHTQRPSFADWPLHLRMSRELVRLNRELMLSPPVAALPAIP